MNPRGPVRTVLMARKIALAEQQRVAGGLLRTCRSRTASAKSGTVLVASLASSEACADNPADRTRFPKTGQFFGPSVRCTQALILALDTSTTYGSVAVWDGMRVVLERGADVNGGHGATLVPLIHDVLSAAGTPTDALRAIAVGIGPGTFTGLRVGLATAQGLALGWNLPVIGISSLAALAHVVRERAAVIVPMLDARRGEVYVAAYRDGREILAAQVGTPAQIVPQLQTLHTPLYCCGTGFECHRAVWESALGAQCRADTATAPYPAASAVAQLAALQLTSDTRPPCDALVPHYVRASYAKSPPA